jgi:transposase
MITQAGGIAIQHHSAVLEHIVIVGNGERDSRTLLDQDNGQVEIAADGHEPLHEVFDYDRRKTEREFVDPQHLGSANQSAGNRERLAFATGQQSRGGLTTKIHAVVDALGNPVAFTLTPGQTADITQAAPLLEKIEPGAFLADKGYDADTLIATLAARGITPVIPSKANRREPRKTDFALYRERNLVERFFCKIKQYRAIATRYDKLANTLHAAVTLVCLLLWLN